jgi:hypothetical protein
MSFGSCMGGVFQNPFGTPLEYLGCSKSVPKLFWNIKICEIIGDFDENQRTCSKTIWGCSKIPPSTRAAVFVEHQGRGLLDREVLTWAA